MTVLHLFFGVCGNATALFLFLAPTKKPFVSPNNILVTTINGTGAVIETVYVFFYLFYAPKKEKMKIGGLFALVLAVFTTVALVSLLAFHGKNRKLFCGLAATVFSIIMYGSPLSIMRVVIRTKSVEYMPFLLSLFVFLCGTSWFVYGLLGHDPFVAIPNGFGCGLGAMQLILYSIYCDKNKQGKATEEDALEMGLGKKKLPTSTNAQTAPHLNGHV